MALNDKMDPSAVTNLIYQFDMFYENGYVGSVLYLETMVYLFSAIYNKNLSPQERIYNESTVRTILTLLHEATRQFRVTGRHFISTESFADFIIAC